LSSNGRLILLILVLKVIWASTITKLTQDYYQHRGVSALRVQMNLLSFAGKLSR
jgi:hypothetical protein